MTHDRGPRYIRHREHLLGFREATDYNSGMKYSLRSLMIVVLVGPPLLAGAYFFLVYVSRLPSTSVVFTLATLVMVGRLVLVVMERMPRRGWVPMLFTIRDLFLVTVIVALAVSWGITYRELARTRRQEQIWTANSLEMRHIMAGENCRVEFTNDGVMTVEWVSKPSGNSAQLPTSSSPATNTSKPWQWDTACGA
jgi:hypothetical protein